jgi:PPOX class probable F420-dependent enzyme
MPQQLDERSRRLIEADNYAQVGTVRADGFPQVNPTWVDIEDGLILLNSAEGRLWPRNLRRNGRAALAVQNMDDPEEYVAIRGRLAGETHEGADEHMHKLARKYRGEERYPLREGEVRVILKIRPEHVHRHGGP